MFGTGSQSKRVFVQGGGAFERAIERTIVRSMLIVNLEWAPISIHEHQEPGARKGLFFSLVSSFHGGIV